MTNSIPFFGNSIVKVMKEQIFDVMIIGQGLAGSVLALEFLERGKSVVVLDNGHISCASLAAIGIYNPLIIKRLRKSWKALELIEHSKAYFKRVEKTLNAKIIYDRPIHRVFANEEEEKHWSEKSGLAAWADLVENSQLTLFDKTFSTGKVKHTGWLDIPTFLEKTREHLTSKDRYMKCEIDHSDLHFVDDRVSINDVKARKAILCEGYKVLQNPYFNSLPLSPVKGEILVVKDPQLNLEEILKTAFFISPIGNDLYKIGATFQWDDLNENISEKARTQLLDKTKAFMSDEAEVLEQIAGVRPAVKDRRPLIGRHHEINNLYIFNGMGTRGIMLAPYFSGELFNYIYKGKTLDPEVDIQRFN
ncbi:MAG: FAD-binding oxidoreductase [Flavobacteriales bacterium]|nr:FAD-binding oxidoreductase [Flavobacteriales bacterium]